MDLLRVFVCIYNANYLYRALLTSKLGLACKHLAVVKILAPSSLGQVLEADKYKVLHACFSNNCYSTIVAEPLLS